MGEGSLEVVSGAPPPSISDRPSSGRCSPILLLHVGEIVSIDRPDRLTVVGGATAHRRPFDPDLRLGALGRRWRRSVGQLIVTRQPGYQLLAAGGRSTRGSSSAWSTRASGASTAGDRPDWRRSVLRSALALWRGPALSDFAYEEFAQPYIRRLTTATSTRSRSWRPPSSRRVRSQRRCRSLEAAIREDPLRERSREILMLALYRSGRHAEALRTYQRLRALLVDELGLDPSPALQRLQERILLHDPTLAPGPGAPVAVGRSERTRLQGPSCLRRADAGDFFGRESLIGRLLDAIRAGNRLIALVGPSGSGKSSVVAAGLIPRLRAGATPGSERWVIARSSRARIPSTRWRPCWAAPAPLAEARRSPAIRAGPAVRDAAVRSIADGRARPARHRPVRGPLLRRRRARPAPLPARARGGSRPRRACSSSS